MRNEGLSIRKAVAEAGFHERTMRRRLEKEPKKSGGQLSLQEDHERES